jgi:hypothetical protein
MSCDDCGGADTMNWCETCMGPDPSRVQVKSQPAEERLRLLERIGQLEIVIHALRRMAESGLVASTPMVRVEVLKGIIDTCEAELPEAMPKNGE